MVSSLFWNPALFTSFRATSIPGSLPFASTTVEIDEGLRRIEIWKKDRTQWTLLHRSRASTIFLISFFFFHANKKISLATRFVTPNLVQYAKFQKNTMQTPKINRPETPNLLIFTKKDAGGNACTHGNTFPCQKFSSFACRISWASSGLLLTRFCTFTKFGMINWSAIDQLYQRSFTWQLLEIVIKFSVRYFSVQCTNDTKMLHQNSIYDKQHFGFDSALCQMLLN